MKSFYSEPTGLNLKSCPTLPTNLNCFRRGGVELRLWRAILDHRLHNPTNHLRRASSTETDMDTNSMVVVECTRGKTTRRTTSNNSSCSNNPTIVIRDQVNGEEDITELIPENGVDNP